MRITDQIDSLEKTILDMPYHTNDSFRIKRSFSQGMPKNMMDYSIQVNNRFLNDNLAIVEEIRHRDPRNIIPKWFVNYQIKQYGNTDILNHDNFFNARLNDGYRKNLNPNLCEIRDIGFLPLGQMLTFSNPVLNRATNGAELEVSSNALTSTGWNGLVIGGRNTSGTAGALYDRIAVNVNSAAGNERLAVYNDNGSGTQPNSVLGEVGSTASSNGYNWRSVTEFSLTTTTIYIAVQVSSSSNNLYYNSGQNQVSASQAFGAFPSGASLTYAASGNTINMKTGHS